MPRLTPVVLSPRHSVQTVRGAHVSIHDRAGRPLWLVLSRYAACPFCSLRLDELAKHHSRIAKAGVELLVVFPSPPERIERYVMRSHPPFGVVADPDGKIFATFGSETSWLGELRTAVNVPKVVRALAHAPNNPLAIDGDVHRMPAEFLIDGRGKLVRAYYGKTLDDGIPPKEVIAWAEQLSAPK